MPSSDFERLMGGMLVVSQGGATLFVWTVEAGLFRLPFIVVFFLTGSVVLARDDAAKAGAGVAAATALGWTAYAGYVAVVGDVGAVGVVYEVPVLAFVGAALAYHSSAASQLREKEEASEV
jgi:hypothetical protein